VVWACVAREGANTGWVKGCVEYGLEGSGPEGGLGRTWRGVVQKDCRARILNGEDGVDHGRSQRLIKIR